jgi:hypothetical protein
MDLIRIRRFLSLLMLSYMNSRYDICKYLSSGTGRSVYFFLLSSSACCITTEACILFVSLQYHIKEQDMSVPYELFVGWTVDAMSGIQDSSALGRNVFL